MVKKVFLQMYYKTIKYLYQLINTLNILVAAKTFIHGNLKKCQKNY